ncbi:erbin isoform X4 [Oncorhynchus tshawytscha]|uniref:erbin isoform X4 n=1 Tax=Oncorhynchus tshawytscha TaxID=74940 RepID=UPI001C3CDC71|nr:erbin isoform X4 [Oncorhynchus tshawytscha]
MSSKRNLFVRLVPCRCLRGEEETVTSLDYSHCSLEAVPKEIFSFEKTLEELYLDANQIEELPKQLFNCQMLHRLSMPDNDLTVLPAAIANLINLKELDVSKNSIQEFPENIKNCKVLAIVEASVNPISKLPEGFTQLLSLTQLYLNDAFLEFLPASFGRLTKLQILELRENQLKMLPKSMHKLTQLERLDLGSNEFTEVPEVLEQLTGIKELWMDGNRLTFLPGMLGTLKQLSYLDVSKNNLEMVDEQICGCESLQDLLLSNNALTQLPGSIGSLKKLTALKVDENQLMYLPDSVGGLRNLPYSFTKLNQMTAMWLSENQSKPLIPLQKEEDPETHKTVLTNYMFPQQTRTEDCIPNSDSESFNPSLWEEQRKQRAQVAFECDEDKDERETPPREGNLKRYPTPYPDELKNMVKTAQSIAHRLKEDESGDESGKDAKPNERIHVGVQDVGVKVIEAPRANGKPVEMEPKAPVCVQDSTVPLETSDSYTSQKTSLRTSDNTKTMNHEDTLESFSLQDSEELSSEEEMKMAEMRPPLIEISINQPKVVALSKDKKDDGKDADSLLDETVANSNQNNSNCSSPSRMSDSVSLTTDSSQDNSLCTPEREAKMPFLPKSRQEDENMNQQKVSTPLLQNGNGPDTTLQALLKNQQSYESKPEKIVGDYDLSMEERLAFIKKGINNGMGDGYTKWDQINMNVAKLPLQPDNMGVQLDDCQNGTSTKEAFHHLPPPYNNENSTAPITDHLENGNQMGDHFNGRSSEGLAVSPMRLDSATSVVRTASAGVTASSDMSLSRSTEELSPVAKAQSITNIETGEMKLYSLDTEGGSYEGGVVGRMAGALPGAQGQSIVRSKSASLLNDQPFQVYPGSSASSSDLLSSSSKPPVSTGRYPVPSGMAMGPPPQYNVQYTSSALPKEGLWTHRTPVPPDQGYLPPPQHSLANTNYSNRNQAPPYPHQAHQRGPPMGPKQPGDMWAKERHLPPGGQPRSSTLQRQSSSSSTASMGDPRRMQVPEGDYMTYRDIHTLGRGPLAIAQTMQRPLSARTYSIDGPCVPRPHTARPQPHELPERTMSVSDFNYQHVSPSKRPNARVKSEHSLLDGPGGPGAGARVPVDWRDQVMRHIEAKKMEKYALSLSYNSNYAPLSSSHYGSSRDVHHTGSQGSLVFSAATDGRPYGAQGICDDVLGPQGQQGYTMDTLRKVPLMNGQMCGPVRGQMTSCQAPMARHPSREQLIDYLMLKVSHGQQPQGPPQPRATQDTLHQEMRVKVEKNPELGFSISGGVGGRGNPFRPDDNGIFVTRVQPEGPVSKILQPGDKILQANGYSFVNIDHGNAVALLKTFPTTVDMIIIREVTA